MAWLLSHLTVLLERLGIEADPIGPKDNPYMIRWILRRRSRAGIRLHQILRSDTDRELHDHPWDFWSLLLTNGYFEHTTQGRFWRHRFSLVRRKATDSHRLELNGPIWTLVWCGPKIREWGFYTPSGWIHQKNYIGEV